ncbi:hypothetical protein EVAR_43369_1 [Eumeta japonica]|uniref:Uncharacterized protein n=1 Tax=Eumeta variegata TaxID=151549 RepID=A0A4C1WQ16_EUMVA|nr:hypothetical protein EVAR_43369_1 [Eumeta japonica]
MTRHGTSHDAASTTTAPIGRSSNARSRLAPIGVFPARDARMWHLMSQCGLKLLQTVRHHLLLLHRLVPNSPMRITVFNLLFIDALFSDSCDSGVRVYALMLVGAARRRSCGYRFSNTLGGECGRGCSKAHIRGCTCGCGF